MLALVSEAMTNALGEAWERGGSLKVRWRQPALVPVEVTARATRRSEADGIATYDASCEDANGGMLLTGTASVRLA